MSGRAASAAFLRDWRAWAPIRSVLTGLDASDADDPRASLATIDTLFADAGWAFETIARLAEAARADPGFGPPFAALGEGVQEGLVLIDHPRATLSLTVVPRDVLGARKVAAGGDGTIGFSGAITCYRVLRGGGARLSWWECAWIDDAFDAVTAAPCRRTGTRHLRDGDRLLVDGRHETFIVEAADADLVLLQATLVPGRAPLRLEYDAVTRGYTAASATDPGASHKQMMATLLRALDHPDAVPALATLTEDPAFFVRWHAARELAAHDRAAAWPVLARMRSDPRPDIAAAARAALERLSPCLA